MSKILDDNMKFDKLFWISTTAMRLNRSHPYIARDKPWRIQFISILILSGVCFMLLLYSIRCDIQNGKFTDSSKNIIMVIVAFTNTYKYAILLHFQDSVNSLINIVDEDYKLSKEFSEEEQRIVLEYAMRGDKVSKFWFVSACTTGAIFPIKAFLLMGKSYFAGDFKLVHMFELSYPWIEDYKDVLVIFIMMFLLTLFFDVYSTSMYIGFDPLVPIFMLHLCGQINILKMRVLKVFSGTDSDSDEIIREKLREIIQKQQHIYSFIAAIKTNFTMVYEFNMKTTTFLLPLTAFQVTESLRNGEVNLEFIGFFTGVILQFYMPCYYSDLLMETGHDFQLALYSCGWEKHFDRRTQRTILFMMTRATKPLVISTVFYAICLDTFAKMCREAYSIFNLMNAAWV